MTKRSQVQRTDRSTWRTTCLVPQIDLTPALDWPAKAGIDALCLHALGDQLFSALQRHGLVFVDDSQLPVATAKQPFRRSVRTGTIVCRLLELTLGLETDTLTTDLANAPRRLSVAPAACESWPRTAYSSGTIISDLATDPGMLVIGANLFGADHPDNSLEPVTALVAGIDDHLQRVNVPKGCTLIRGGAQLAHKTAGRIPACKSMLIVTEGLAAHYDYADQNDAPLIQVASAISLGEPAGVRSRPRPRPVRTSVHSSSRRRAA